jgi:hypothetical protein
MKPAKDTCRDTPRAFEPRHATLLATAAFSVWIAMLSLPLWTGRFLGGAVSDQYHSGYAYRHWLAEEWKQTGRIPLWNPERGIAMAWMREPEAMLEALDHIRTFEPFETGTRANNRVIALIAAGRRAEARRIAAATLNERRRPGLQVEAAALDAAWGEVDSLERELRRYDPREAIRWRGVLHYVRGEVHAGDSPWGHLAEPWRMVLHHLAARRRVQGPFTSASVGGFGPLWAALAGDTAGARARLADLTADTLNWLVESGFLRAYVEAGIAWHANDWRGVVQRTGPIFRERAALNIPTATAVRWIAADASEQRAVGANGAGGRSTGGARSGGAAG